jgi:hypothetical protein
MNDGDDEGRFGFAPRGGPVHGDRRPRRPTPRLGASAAEGVPHRAPIAAGVYSATVEPPAWAWLLIGFLLGTGATLLTSSLWLPDTDARRTAAIDPAIAATSDMAASPDLPDRPSEAAALETAEGPTPPAPTIDAFDAAQRPDASGEPAEKAAAEAGGGEPTLADSHASEPASRVETPVAGSIVEDGGGDATDIQIAASAEPAPTTDDESTRAIDALLAAEQRLVSAAQRFGAGGGAAPPSGEDVARPQPRPERAEDPPPFTIGQVIRSETQAKSVEEPRIRPPQDRHSPYRVQLAAVDNEAAAQIYWREANDRLPEVFESVTPVFDQRQVNDRLYFRIWVGAFGSKIDAAAYCDWLKSQGQDCFVTRADSL